MAYVAEQRQEINISSSGDNTLITGVAGSQIKIVSIVLWSQLANTIIFKDGSTTINGAGFNMPAQSGWDHEFQGKVLRLTAGNSFKINLSAAAAVTGWIEYIQS